MNARYVAKQLETIVDDANARIQALADEYREQVVLPYCQRHGLTYMAGNGIWVFYAGDDSIPEDELPGNPTKMIEVLNSDTLGRVNAFGFHISDVLGRDIKERK